MMLCIFSLNLNLNKLKKKIRIGAGKTYTMFGKQQENEINV